MTNFEKIKEMSKEELVNFFYDILSCEDCFINVDNMCNHHNCKTSIKEWLEQEAEE
ncbi:MAG: hypothetical protein K6G88_05750 [Lachnospiraceae bacterium]|nr:hypothetical protein [Lachnospiraceae bacterium]